MIASRRPRPILGEALLAAVVVTGCLAQPAPSPGPSGIAATSPSGLQTTSQEPGGPTPPAPSAGPVETVTLARTTAPITPRWGPTPEGPELRDDFGENVVVLDPGKTIIVLGDPQPGPDGTWVPGYVVPDDRSWPVDFVAWIPAIQRGQPTLERVEREGCPGAATIGTVAPLLAADRRRCIGSAEITLMGRTWRPVRLPAYDADPIWLGANTDQRRTVAVFDGGDDPFGRGIPLAPFGRPFVDARVPPEIDVPPLGMVVSVAGHFDDPAAATCTRRLNLQLGPGQVVKPGWGVPPEDQAVSAEWCRDQFVVSSWEVVLGPEGRPIDLAAPQLHRMPVFDAPRGMPLACGGVGMPPLTVRIDLSQIDPVWLDVQGGGRSVAVFSKGFRLVSDGGPAVVASNGVTLVNGESLGANGEKAGLEICTEGDLVAFWVPGETS